MLFHQHHSGHKSKPSSEQYTTYEFPKQTWRQWFSDLWYSDHTGLTRKIENGKIKHRYNGYELSKKDFRNIFVKHKETPDEFLKRKRDEENQQFRAEQILHKAVEKAYEAKYLAMEKTEFVETFPGSGTFIGKRIIERISSKRVIGSLLTLAAVPAVAALTPGIIDLMANPGDYVVGPAGGNTGSNMLITYNDPLGRGVKAVALTPRSSTIGTNGQCDIFWLHSVVGKTDLTQISLCTVVNSAQTYADSKFSHLAVIESKFKSDDPSSITSLAVYFGSPQISGVFDETSLMGVQDIHNCTGFNHCTQITPQPGYYIAEAVRITFDDGDQYLAIRVTSGIAYLVSDHSLLGQGNIELIDGKLPEGTWKVSNVANGANVALMTTCPIKDTKGITKNTLTIFNFDRTQAFALTKESFVRAGNSIDLTNLSQINGTFGEASFKVKPAKAPTDLSCSSDGEGRIVVGSSSLPIPTVFVTDALVTIGGPNVPLNDTSQTAQLQGVAGSSAGSPGTGFDPSGNYFVTTAPGSSGNEVCIRPVAGVPTGGTHSACDSKVDTVFKGANSTGSSVAIYQAGGIPHMIIGAKNPQLSAEANGEIYCNIPLEKSNSSSSQSASSSTSKSESDSQSQSASASTSKSGSDSQSQSVSTSVIPALSSSVPPASSVTPPLSSSSVQSPISSGAPGSNSNFDSSSLAGSQSVVASSSSAIKSGSLATVSSSTTPLISSSLNSASMLGSSGSDRLSSHSKDNKLSDLAIALVVLSGLTVFMLGAFCTVMVVLLRRGRNGYNRVPTSMAMERGEERFQKIDSKDIFYGRSLGNGACGEVYAAVWKNAQVAVKKLQGPLAEERDMVAQFIQEAEIQARLRYPNIVCLYGFCAEPHMFLIVMELAKESLDNFLYNKKRPFSEGDRFKVISGIANGLAFMHSQGIIHRDMKSANVLLFEDMTPKIADLGAARIIDKSAAMTDVIGTAAYMAPEIIMVPTEPEIKPYTTAIDVYSFAIILWEIFAREVPYKNMPQFGIIGQVKLGTRPEIDLSWDFNFVRLMQQCWNHDPEARPNMSDVLGCLNSINLLSPTKIEMSAVPPEVSATELPEGLEEVKLPGDGHCLFRAVSIHLEHTTPEELRKIAADFMLQHKERFRQGRDDKSFDEYLLRVRTDPSCWGGHPEMIAIASFYNIPIIVLLRNPQTKKISLTITRSVTQNINGEKLTGFPFFVLYNDVDHYDGLAVRDNYNARDIYAALLKSNSQSYAELVAQHTNLFAKKAHSEGAAIRRVNDQKIGTSCKH